MEHNLILAGVGGQGILTIARAISTAALHRGLNVKQAETHGMAQRGGAVQSHLRLSDRPIHSDTVPMGQADMILSVEPLEALRYVHYLREGGAVISSTNSYINIDSYPSIEPLLDRIAAHPRHALVDADRLARAAGSGRTANAVMLGAAGLFLDFEPGELLAALDEIFASKGEAVLETNRRAACFGRNAVTAYCDALRRGGTSGAARHWVDTLSSEHLAAEGDLDASGFEGTHTGEGLSAAELHAVELALKEAGHEGRTRLYEHEVYRLVQLVGAISPPRYAFVPRGDVLSTEDHARLPGERVVLKIVSPDIVHKSDAHGIVFLKNDYELINREITRLADKHAATARVDGVLVVEAVEREAPGLGNELFVGIRNTREFGPVIAAGLGGIDTEYLAHKMRPGLAVAKAAALDVDAEQFFELFQRTAAYEILAGHARGRRRVASDGELVRCFDAFLSIARNFCVDRGEDHPALLDLEVNPFAFRHQRMIPLDGRGRLGRVVAQPVARPLGNVDALLEPRSVAVLGVSAQSMNFGRIILDNVRESDPTRPLWVVKEGLDELDGVPCVPDVASLPEPVDLLVIAAGGDQLPALLQSIGESGKVRSSILIPGGVGETEHTGELMQQVRSAIQAGRDNHGNGPVYIGPNCMGVQSRPGNYDTFFVPRAKLDNRWDQPARPVALISQSGAFLASRLSNLEQLDPALAISIGNQIDLTVSDLLRVVGARDDIEVIGVYIEGFNDLDGLEFLRAVQQVSEAGKLVVFYKAGRTAAGQSAAASHTAAVAGDYDVCQAAVASAGALVVDTFREFEQLIQLSCGLHDKQVGGQRIGVISNAGFETVAMADNVVGRRYRVQIAELDQSTSEQLRAALARHRLDGLVTGRNPLDLTPMANEEAYEDAARIMLDCEQVDALVVSVVPMTPALATLEEQLEAPGSLADRLPALAARSSKPVIFVVDAGDRYDALARRVAQAGLPVFRTCDQAIRSLGRYLCHRGEANQGRTQAPAAPTREVELVG